MGLPQPAVVEPATREQIAVDPNSFFQVGMFKDAAKARYRRQNTKDMAIAAWKIAELLNEHFANYHIRCMVPASAIAPDCNPHALPVHFLFYDKRERPRVAMVIVTQNGYNVPNVRATKAICEGNGLMRTGWIMTTFVLCESTLMPTSKVRLKIRI